MVVLAAPWTLSHQHLLLLCLCEQLERNAELFFSCWATPFTLFLSLIKLLSALTGGAGCLTWRELGFAKPHARSSLRFRPMLGAYDFFFFCNYQFFTLYPAPLADCPFLGSCLHMVSFLLTAARLREGLPQVGKAIPREHSCG